MTASLPPPARTRSRRLGRGGGTPTSVQLLPSSWTGTLVDNVLGPPFTSSKPGLQWPSDPDARGRFPCCYAPFSCVHNAPASSPAAAAQAPPPGGDDALDDKLGGFIEQDMSCSQACRPRQPLPLALLPIAPPQHGRRRLPALAHA